MRSSPWSIPLLAALLASAACAADPLDKDEARAAGKADGADLCAENGWYGDGECDTFCAAPDPDCSGCPDPAAPGVTYISQDPIECAALTFSCPDGQEPFSDECGCGCVPPPATSCPDPSRPGVDFMSHDPLQCAAITFECDPGDLRFDDGCGCGCVDPDAGACPDPAAPGVHYIGESNLDPSICLAITFGCADNQRLFSDECGCGCIDEQPAACPDPDDPAVHYIGDSHTDPQICTVITFSCEEGQTAFSDACGCGCVDP